MRRRYEAAAAGVVHRARSSLKGRTTECSAAGRRHPAASVQARRLSGLCAARGTSARGRRQRRQACKGACRHRSHHIGSCSLVNGQRLGKQAGGPRRRKGHTRAPCTRRGASSVNLDNTQQSCNCSWACKAVHCRTPAGGGGELALVAFRFLSPGSSCSHLQLFQRLICTGTAHRFRDLRREFKDALFAHREPLQLAGQPPAIARSVPATRLQACCQPTHPPRNRRRAAAAWSAGRSRWPPCTASPAAAGPGPGADTSMGNAGSAHAQASLQVIARLSGGEALPLSSAEWQPLLSYAPPLSRYDPDEVEREIRPHCAELGAWLRVRAALPAVVLAAVLPLLQVLPGCGLASCAPACPPTQHAHAQCTTTPTRTTCSA